MLEAFKNADVPVRGFIYDGLHIGCKDPVKIKQIFEMGYRKQQEIFGFTLPFTIKDWAEPIEKCLPEEEVDDATYFEYFNAVNSETLSKVIYSYLNGNYLVENKTLKWYRSGVWTSGKTDSLYGFLKTPIYNEIRNKMLLYKIEKKIISIVLTNTGNSSTFASALNDALKYNSQEIHNIHWDEHPNLLNFKNGTYNFHTHLLQPHNRDEFITKQVPCDFDPQQLKAHDSITDIFKDWFEIKGRCEGKEMSDYVNYLLYLLSVCLDGSNDYQKALILYGRLSRNGKSSFCDLMNKALGSYCGSIPYTHFTQNDRDANAPKPYILALQGIRYAFVNEADNSHHEVRGINNKPFKEMTGKDLLTARDLYGNKNDLVSFKPQFLIIMPCNDVVRFMKEENATTNRLSVFNFDCYFGDEGMVGWSKDKPYCKVLDGDYKRNVIENKIISTQFIHHLIFLNKSWGSDWTNIEAPIRQVEDEKSYKGEVDEIKSWTDQYVVYDKTPFDANTEKDKFICGRHPNIDSKKRVMTLDSLYFNYKKDVTCATTYRDFITSITAILMMYMIKKR
jgi:phage/plasmid-associated DNA primase